MEIANSQKPRRIRVVSGPIAVVENELEAMFDDWTAMVWNFIEVQGSIVMSVVMVNNSEMRKAAIAQAGSRFNNRT